MTIRAEILLDASGSAASREVHLIRELLPATLIQRGLITTDTIKIEVSQDDEVEPIWFDANDGGTVLTFAATGKNLIPVNNPMLFRVKKTGITAVAITSVVTGTAIPAGGTFARFTWVAGPILFVGQKVLVAGFTVSSPVGNLLYNTVGVITVKTTTTFEMVSLDTGLPIKFAATGTGTYEPFAKVTLSFGTDV